MASRPTPGRALITGGLLAILALAGMPGPLVRALGGVAPALAAPRPNIVFILTDDQRWDTLDEKHSVDGQTPVMKKATSLLVDTGILFQNSFVTTALCCPSRSSILAGQYAHTTGVHDNGGPDGGVQVFDDSSTLPVWLHAVGYRTGIFGKYLNGYAAIAPYQAPGWDEWHVFKAPGYFAYHLIENGADVAYGSAATDYSTDVLRDKVVEFINQSAPPFFVEFTPYSPHAPATPAPRHVGSFVGVPPWRPKNHAEPDASDKPTWVQSIAWTQTDQQNTDTFRQSQLECLQAVDEAVDAIVQALRAKDVLNDTIILYTSDNGYSWGSHRWKPKECEYEECMRVPLVVRYAPLVPTSRKEDRIALNIDYAETFAELAGATPDPGVEGVSLVPLLANNASGWRSDMLNEHWNGKIPTFAQVRGAFTKSGDVAHAWKYVELVSGEKELYNEDTDPFELVNVVADPSNAPLVAIMAARLRELDPGWTGTAQAAPSRVAAGPDYMNDDALEAGDERSSGAIAVLEDLWQGLALSGAEGFEAEVVEDEGFHPGEAAERGEVGSVDAHPGELVEERGDAAVDDRVAVAAGLVGERAGQVALPEGGVPGEDHEAEGFEAEVVIDETIRTGPMDQGARTLEGTHVLPAGSTPDPPPSPAD